MFLISLRRRTDRQSRSQKSQCGLFRIRALFASLQPPGHSSFSFFLLFWSSMRLTRACWEVLSPVSWFQEPATAFGTGPFLQVTLLCPLGTCFWAQNQIRTRTGTTWRLYRGNNWGWLGTLRAHWSAQGKSSRCKFAWKHSFENYLQQTTELLIILKILEL
jgi:hypothetical protein